MRDFIEIRPVRKEDITIINELIYNCFNEFISGDYSEEGINEFLRFINTDNIIKRYDQGSYILVACSNEKIVGVIELKDFIHISLLFVSKDYHKRGIARELVNKAIEVCVKNYYIKAITVNSSHYAIEIYEKLGFYKIENEKCVNGIKFTPMKIDINSKKQVELQE